MDFGKRINTLRRQKDVTQDELAAELGVTAAAVSKWENGYTLPDILMLCALADYFQVTTDELLGRNPNVKYCVIAAASAELGEAIGNLVKSYGFTAKQIFSSYAEAQAAAQADRTITHLFASFEKALTGEDKALNPDGLHVIEAQAPTVRQVVDGFTIYLQNMGAYDTITQK